LDERQDLREGYFLVIVVNAQFGVAQIASNVNVRDSRARLDQLLELLRSAEFVGLAGDDKAQLELTCMAAGFGRARTGRMMVVVAVIMVMVMVMMVMIVIVMIVPMVMLTLMLMVMIMLIVLMMIMVVIMLATRAMNMFVVFRFRHGNL